MDQDSPFIVVIDDSNVMCTILAVALSRAGYRVQTFQDPTEALRALKGSMPNLFIIDIKLPKMDGYTVIQNIKQNPLGKPIPIVAISARSRVVDRLKARLAGANAFIAKPFKMQDVVVIVADLISRSQGGETGGSHE